MNNKLIKSSFLLIAITVLAKLLGLIREIVMANYLGTSAISDAYVLGTTISQIIVTGLAGAFFKTYIPIATEERYKSHQCYVNFTAQLLFIGTGFFVLISCVVYATAEYTTYWLSLGASQTIIDLAIGVCKATAFPSAFLLMINVLQGFLHTQEKFLSNIIYPVVMNLTIIAGLIIGKGSINSLSVSYGCSIIFSAITLWIYSKKIGLTSFSIKETFKNKAVKKAIWLTMPLFFGGVVSEINEIIDRCFSAYYAEGVLTALRYGKLLEIFIVSAIGIAIGQAVYPQIALLKQENKIEELENLISILIEVFFFFSIPIFIGVIILGKDLITVIFLRGAFDYKSVEYTSIAFIIYSISILPVSLNEILSRVFFAYNDTKNPVMYSILAMGTNILLNGLVVFTFKMEFYCLAMTTSICESLLALFYLYGIKTKIKLNLKIDLRLLFHVIVSSLLMGIAIYVIKIKLPNYSWLKLCSLTVIGFCTYFLVILVLDRGFFKEIAKQIRRK